MIQGRNVVVAFLVASAIAASVCADMMPIPAGNPSYASIPSPCDRPIPARANRRDLCIEFAPAAVDLLALASSLGLQVDIDSANPAGPALQVLSHDQSSLDLCLYALVGLGLCRSGRWVRKASLGFVPDWYHNSGPFQIGHSHAVSPDKLCPVPVCCFIQPDAVPDHSLPPCCTDAIASLRHPSQHTPASLISRGPPLCS